MINSNEWDKLDIVVKIERQINSWKQNPQNEIRPFITISREFGSEGWSLAKLLSSFFNDHLISESDPNWLAYDKGIISILEGNYRLLKKLEESIPSEYLKSVNDFYNNELADKKVDFYDLGKTGKIIRMLALNGNVALVGRGGQCITKDLPNGFHIKVIANIETRVAEIAQRYGISVDESKDLINRVDQERKEIHDCFMKGCLGSFQYDMIIDRNSVETLNQALKMVIKEMIKREIVNQKLESLLD